MGLFDVIFRKRTSSGVETTGKLFECKRDNLMIRGKAYRP